MTNEYRVKLEFLEESRAVFQRHMKTCTKLNTLNVSFFLLLLLYLLNNWLYFKKTDTYFFLFLST